MRNSTILLSIIGMLALSTVFVSAETQDEGEGSTLECVFEDNIGNCLRKRLARDIDRIEIEVSGKKSEPPMSEVIEQTGNFIAEFVSDVQEELQEDEEEIAEREAGVDSRALGERLLPPSPFTLFPIDLWNDNIDNTVEWHFKKKKKQTEKATNY